MCVAIRTAFRSYSIVRVQMRWRCFSVWTMSAFFRFGSVNARRAELRAGVTEVWNVIPGKAASCRRA